MNTKTNTQSMSTLYATTNRPVTFSTINPRTREVTDIHTWPAGTHVTVKIRRNGDMEARVIGTRYTQTILPDTVVPE